MILSSFFFFFFFFNDTATTEIYTLSLHDALPIFAANGNRLPLILVRPSRVVAVARDGQRKIGCPRHVVGLAVVQRLKLCQLIGVLLDQIRQLVHQYTALRSAHLAPRALVERRARCRHRLVHIRRVGLRHLRDHFTRRWIDRRERFSRSAVHPFPVDQKFCRANLDIPFHQCRCRSHFELLLRWCSARRWVRSKTPQAPPGASILRERSLYPRTD